MTEEMNNSEGMRMNNDEGMMMKEGRNECSMENSLSVV